MSSAADIIAAVPEPDAPEVAKVTVGVGDAKRSRSGTSGAERARRAKAGTTPKRAPAAKVAPLEERLTNTLVMIGVGWSMVHQADGMVFTNGAPELATALVKLGDTKPRVRRALEGFCSASAYAELTAALLPIAVGIGANHNMVPPHVMAALGMTPPPDTTPYEAELAAAQAQETRAA